MGKKELTLGEAAGIYDAIKAEHPTENDPFVLVVYAYIKGYEAAQKEKEV